MKRRRKVLIIEDKKDWQEILKEYLEEAGFYVEIVSNLQDGLDKIKNENFHFATIDLQLDLETINPFEFEGWEILDKIVEYRAEMRLPTMVITGFDYDYVKFSRIKKLYGTYFMPKKEFDRKVFIEKVKFAVESLDIRFFDEEKVE